MHFNVPLWIQNLRVQVLAASQCLNISKTIQTTGALLRDRALSKNWH